MSAALLGTPYADALCVTLARLLKGGRIELHGAGVEPIAVLPLPTPPFVPVADGALQVAGMSDVRVLRTGRPTRIDILDREGGVVLTCPVDDDLTVQPAEADAGDTIVVRALRISFATGAKR